VPGNGAPVMALDWKFAVHINPSAVAQRAACISKTVQEVAANPTNFQSKARAAEFARTSSCVENLFVEAAAGRAGILKMGGFEAWPITGAFSFVRSSCLRAESTVLPAAASTNRFSTHDDVRANSAALAVHINPSAVAQRAACISKTVQEVVLGVDRGSGD
jgi:hypothetical protein